MTARLDRIRRASRLVLLLALLLAVAPSQSFAAPLVPVHAAITADPGGIVWAALSLIGSILQLVGAILDAVI